jgi:putative glutamine amidotransferase
MKAVTEKIMRTILLTQRVDVVQGYRERRDCLDQAWYRFIEDCGFLPAPAPNRPDIAEALAERLNPAAMILTGGNDLAAYGGDAPERDATEKRLLEYAMAKGIPVLGVCRGMQFLHCYFGGTLQQADGHVGVFHRLMFEDGETEVNSYHRFVARKPAEPFLSLAVSEDGTMEAMRHKSQNILGIMWHPERERESHPRDIGVLQNLIRGMNGETQ